MKKTAILLLCSVLILGISSCTKTKQAVDELTEFDINYTTNLNIPSTSFTTFKTSLKHNLFWNIIKKNC